MMFWILWTIDALITLVVLSVMLWGFANAAPQQPGAPADALAQALLVMGTLVAAVGGGIALWSRGYRRIAGFVAAVPVALAAVIGLFVVYLVLNPPRH